MAVFPPVEVLGVLGGVFVTDAGAGTAGGAEKLYEVATGMLGAGVLGGTELLVAGAGWTAGATGAGAWDAGTSGAGTWTAGATEGA